ncbi:MAG TPA: murein biosynthesis integral membrane protein MurJ [Thermoanaerobaculia bacterium]|jgi:putative peptidoglycan lipid II flippase|nr:murein biosynthesis integral membrane protein MurJ [Thermoanaerobaculia bacterium]
MNSDPADADLPRQPPIANRQPKFGGYAALVAAGILLSRVAGLIRTSVFAHYLGASAAADAFNVALKVPNFLQNLLGEGVLSASFIPVYSRLLARGEQKVADRVAGVFVSFLALIVLAIVILGVIFAPVILGITAAGLDPPVMELAIKFTRILFPGVGLLVLYAWALGILNAHRQFFTAYVAPVLWSAAMIATLLIFGMRLSGAPLATALAWGTLVGCALQFGIEVPFVLKHAKHLSFGFDRSLEPVKTIFRNIIPVVGGRGVIQISGYVDTFISSFLPTGAVTSLFYAQTVYLLPISVFGMSVAAAELPQMSSEQGSEEEIKAALRKRLDRAVRQVAFFVVPTTVAFIAFGRVLIAALFERGKFSHDTTLLVWYTLVGASLGLLVATMGRLYSSAFYALHDTRTPFRIALARVLGGAALALLFAFPLRPMFPAIVHALGLPLPSNPTTMGIVGITAASAIAGWIEFLLLRRGIRRRVGAGESKAAFMIKLWISALAGGVVGVLTHIYAARAIAARLPFPKISEALLVSLAFGIVYFGVALALGVPEVRATLVRFTRR